MPKVIEISGVGPTLAKALAAKGYRRVESIATATTMELANVPGVGVVRARKLINSARAVLRQVPKTASSSKPKKLPKAEKDTKGSGKKSKKSKKGKKAKRDKKKSEKKGAKSKKDERKKKGKSKKGKKGKKGK